MEDISKIKEEIAKKSADAHASINELYKEAISEDANLEAQEIKNKLEAYLQAKEASINNNRVAVAESKKTKRIKKLRNDLIGGTVLVFLEIALFLMLLDKSERDFLFERIQETFNNLSGHKEIEQELGEEIKPLATDIETTLNSKSDTIVHINDIYNIGDTFTTYKDAPIYSNYLDAAKRTIEDASSPYLNHLEQYERETTGIGFIMPDGTLKFAKDQETEEMLEQQGGVAISLQSQDGYYNIDDTEPNNNLGGR